MTYRPAHDLTVHNAKTVLEDGLQAIAHGQTEIDLGALAVVDSAAVATLLAWARAARRGGKMLGFIHIPANLQSLADLYGVTELLHSISDAGAQQH